MYFELERPERSSRLLVLARLFLMIPLALWLGVLGFIQGFVLIFAWFAILFTDNIPVGVFDFLLGVLRYSVRVNCYSVLLTDEWPGFSIEK